MEENFASTIKTDENAKSVDKFNRFFFSFDTAATTHFFSNKNLMKNFKEIEDVDMLLAIGNSRSKVFGKGAVKFVVKIDGKINMMTLDNLLYNLNL